MYMREFLRWQRIRYFKEQKEWKIQCKIVAQQHNLHLIKINVYNVLEDKPLDRSKPILPPPPVERIFIPEARLKEMVKESVDMKNYWTHILTGQMRTPLLKKLRVVKALK